MSAVMLARIGPVKPFVAKTLIAHSEGPLCSRSVTISAGAPPGLGTHRYVSVVSAEIVGGTLPTRPG